MKYVLVLLGFLFCTAAQAQDALVVATCGTNPQTYTPGATRLLTVDQNGKLCNSGGGGAGNPGGTSGQIQYNNAGSFGGFTASGDLTVNTSTGAVTFATVNSNVGSFGSATQCAAVTVNAKGLITAISAATCTPAIGSVSGLGTGVGAFLATPSSANLLAALTTSTGTGNAVFGTAPTISSLNASVAMTLAFLTGGGTQCVQVSNTGVVSGTGSACGGSGSTGANPTATAGPTAVNGSAITFMRSDGAPAVQLGTGSVPGLVQCGLGLTCTSGVAGAQVTQRNNTATTDTLLSTDAGTTVTENNASAVIVGIAVATTSGFGTGQYWTLKNKGAGLVTLTPTTSTIDGNATLQCKTGQSADIYSDGTNYITLSNTCGQTQTIASGTAALGTSAIASGACATVVTVSATGVATTDTMTFGYNGDPTAVTGYGASATGAVLSIYPYPSSGNVNVKVCNSTSGSITPGSMTLNFRVTR